MTPLVLECPKTSVFLSGTLSICPGCDLVQSVKTFLANSCLSQFEVSYAPEF